MWRVNRQKLGSKQENAHVLHLIHDRSISLPRTPTARSWVRRSASAHTAGRAWLQSLEHSQQHGHALAPHKSLLAWRRSRCWQSTAAALLQSQVLAFRPVSGGRRRWGDAWDGAVSDACCVVVVYHTSCMPRVLRNSSRRVYLATFHWHTPHSSQHAKCLFTFNSSPKKGEAGSIRESTSYCVLL
jgi:hypothetical protein